MAVVGSPEDLTLIHPRTTLALRRRQRCTGIALFVGTVAVLASCSKSAAAPVSDSGSPTANAADAAAPDDMAGKAAPDFTATAHDGTVVHLAALRGRPVVVYFYGNDETPASISEASAFRDKWDGIAKTGAVVVGVSTDSLESHRSFADRHKLPFLFVTDEDRSLGRAFAVPYVEAGASLTHKGWYQRQTFVVGRDGKIRNVYRHVDVTVHARQVLDDLTRAG